MGNSSRVLKIDLGNSPSRCDTYSKGCSAFLVKDMMIKEKNAFSKNGDSYALSAFMTPLRNKSHLIN